ncbi:MAG: F0F1 ATP synthase subunit delta [Gammaproteobacteria bacterium]|nr:F0F1 ATP synthase subunit delta [Gammaproteobacteria bacterium]
MQERLTIARPYALAAFDVARQQQELDSWSAALEFLAAVVGDQKLRELAADPRVGTERLTALLLDLGGARFNERQCNFIRTLVRAGRIEVAPEIAQLFAQRRADAEGTLNIEVVSAYPLDQQQQDAIAQAVRQRLGRNIVVNSSIDPGLIGGAVIRAGDMVIDLSVRGRLASLAASLV